MNDGDEDRDERTDVGAAPEEDEKLDDLEPAEGERAGVKGGGPKSESSQTGPGPEN